MQQIPSVPGFKDTYRPKVMAYSLQGMSREEILANLSSDMDTNKFLYDVFNEIQENIDEFNDLVNEYKDLAYAWWMAQGRRFVIETTGVGVEKLNFQTWYAVMRNRFGWTDLKKLSMDGELRLRLTDDERKERINRLEKMFHEN